MKYSVVIAERNEPDLKATVADIKANNDCHVIVQSDTKGIGPQAMRDRGIELATGSDVVIVMDGHMRTQKGALDAMAKWVRKNPTSVSVARCHHSASLDWTGQPYSGASFAWKDYGDAAKKQPTVMVGKWRKDHDIGQIPCVMGACYAFSRSWYMDALRRPWQWGTGWGCDEEVLSAATWLMGGRVDLIPVSVWHQARQAGETPYMLTDAQFIGVTANKCKLIDMLPMSDNERQELRAHLLPKPNPTNKRQLGILEKILAPTREDIAGYNSFLASGPMDWRQFRRDIVGNQTVKPHKMGELRDFARLKGLKTPFQCSKADLFGLLGDKYEKQEKPKAVKEKPEKPKKRKAIANWGANEMNSLGKRCCVHCGGGVTVVNNTRKVSNRLTQRYRKCNDCSKNFPTREITT